MKYKVKVNEKIFEVNLIDIEEGSIAFEINNNYYQVELEPQFKENSSNITTMHTPVASLNSATSSISTTNNPNEIKAPMPGIIVAIHKKEGDKVAKGEAVLVIEAMKMENNISSLIDGIVDKILVKEGDEVSNGQILVTLKNNN